MNSAAPANLPELWPALPIREWSATRETLHLWTQVAGKVRLALAPHINHWWEVALYVNSRGLTTSAIPYAGGSFEMIFDFIRHELVIETSRGDVRTIALAPRTVADFYAETMAALHALGITVKIWTMPQEIPNAIHFDKDTVHASYDPEYANRFWRVLTASAEVFAEFRGRFIGKCSPVHFFWGSFDLAVTRFSGRRAPERAGADRVARDAYSHEVSSVGFWPGLGEVDAVFYGYAAPEPPGFSKATVAPAAARYDATFSEFFLPYKEVRKSASPREMLLSFLQSTYEATANLGNWDRPALEYPSTQK